LAYVLGYTCGNDVSARDWQKGDLQWWRAKGCDTFAPLGPWIATNIDPTNLELQTRVNGEVVQRTNTSLLIHDVARLVSFASQAMTLEPGDVLFTGTPGTTAPLGGGDVVEVEIEGIGVLRNRVEAAV
jgi:2-keto-4-pentenoate hydratase/2-oxohepta-3-ene-1,7-dioic acid hydratase in catechol pathway